MKPIVFSTCLLLTLFSACTVSKSQKSIDFNYRPARVYLVVDAGNFDPVWGNTFVDGLERELAAQLRHKNVELGYLPYNQVSLESQTDRTQRIREFNADVVMYVTMSTPRNTENGQLNYLDIKIMPVDKDKILWRGAILRSGIWVGRNGGYSCARKLVKQLEEDKVL